MRQEYLAAGGDPDAYEDFWKIKAPELVAERIHEKRASAARAARAADPRQYINGLPYIHGETVPADE
jgi:hypothetical protein